MKKKITFFIVAIVTLAMALLAAFGFETSSIEIKGGPDMRFGTDIRGGVEAAFQPEDTTIKVTTKQLEAARSIIETRLNQNNIMDYETTIDSTNAYILVRFPWKADETEYDAGKAINELGKMAKLTFRNEQGEVILDGTHVKDARADKNQYNEDVVGLIFDAEGTGIFREATKKMIGQTISIYMDEVNIQTATVIEEISNGEAQISGMENREVAQKLADQINSGALPFSMTASNYSTISPSMGKGALNIMLQAGLVAFALICVLLIVYYRLPGFVACIALIMQIAGQILALSIPQMTLTLTGIAGIILSIGMGVDANVIASERINEEIRSGKSVSSAIAAGFSNSFSSIFDGNITVLIVSVVLMIFGSGSLLSFAYTLFIGIIFNFIAGVTASRLMILSLSSYKFLNKPALYTCFTRRVTL